MNLRLGHLFVNFRYSIIVIDRLHVYWWKVYTYKEIRIEIYDHGDKKAKQHKEDKSKHWKTMISIIQNNYFLPQKIRDK